VQSAQAPEPQATAVVPGRHWPFPQQPPLHGCDGKQAVVQLWVVGSQDSPGGQSPAPAQPQTPPLPTGRQTPAQAVQAAPLSPQAARAVPALHTPPAQQPPLHGCAGEHAVEHRCCAGSHERPIGQSAAVTQPQPAPRQAWPMRLPLQSPQGDAWSGRSEKSALLRSTAAGSTAAS
jgi:hypothetical protein